MLHLALGRACARHVTQAGVPESGLMPFVDRLAVRRNRLDAADVPAPDGGRAEEHPAAVGFAAGHPCGTQPAQLVRELGPECSSVRRLAPASRVSSSVSRASMLPGSGGGAAPWVVRSTAIASGRNRSGNSGWGTRREQRENWARDVPRAGPGRRRRDLSMQYDSQREYCVVKRRRDGRHRKRRSSTTLRAPRDREKARSRGLSLSCAEEDSNLHPVIPDQALNLARLPIPPSARGAPSIAPALRLCPSAGGATFPNTCSLHPPTGVPWTSGRT
jgi:hypothetical protein